MGKWTADGFDKIEKKKAFNSITVFSPPLPTNLKKSSYIGIPKALQLDTVKNPSLLKADLVSAKKRLVDSLDDKELEYYDFDLAVAPRTCNQGTEENLGLGFCPYEDIVILSATTIDDKLYVFQLECNRVQWRSLNSDLKEIRRSFAIQTLQSIDEAPMLNDSLVSQQ